MKLNKYSLLTLALLSLSANAFAIHYSPIFSGNWYSDADFISQNACGKSSFRYIDWHHGSNQNYASRLLAITVRSDCQWGNVFLKNKNPTKPFDFMGSAQQWQNISDASKSITAELWQRDCLDRQNKVVDSTQITLWPNYICPQGSHYQQSTTDCSNNSLSCNADIVGRDFVEQGSNKLLGHVGFISTLQGKNTVFEVLNDSKAGIFENSLASFVAKSKFWGEKFGLKGKPVLSGKEAINIISKGQEQQKFKFKYTAYWDWNPGSDTVEAVFRCDSFVYYCYVTGAGLMIYPEGFRFPATPPGMFKRFLSFRSTADQTNENPDDPFERYGLLPTDNLTIEEKMARIFSESDLDIAAADQATYYYIMMDTSARSRKMATIFSLLKQHQHDRLAFLYLSDCLTTLDPIELTPEYIKMYQQQPIIELKNNLLSNLAEINYMRHTKSPMEKQKIRDNNINNILLIKNLYKDILSNETNPTLLKNAIELYPSIGDPKTAKEEITVAFKRAEKNQIPLHLTAEEYVRLQLQLAFSNKETQARDLPDIVKEVHNNDTYPLPFYLTSWLEDTSAEELNDELRPLLQDYLLKHRQSMEDYHQKYKKEMNTYSRNNWLSAYATVMVKNSTEKNKYIFDTIRTTPSALLQAQYISEQHGSILQLISKEDRQYYLKRFQRQLKDPLILENEKETLQLAISALNDSATKPEKN